MYTNPFLIAVAILGLSACSQNPSEQTPANNSNNHFNNDEYGLTVPISATGSKADLESKFSGTVTVFRPEDGFAILNLSNQAAEQLKNTISPMKDSGRPVADSGKPALETNKKVFSGHGLAWINGGMTVWAGGGMTVWAGGGMTVWAGGNYQPVPANSAKWQKMNLQAAQTLASNLGAGVKVAVIDTGVDLLHPAFQGSFVPASEMWDYVDNDATPQEKGVLGTTPAYGHGTSVAGIVLQIAPRAKILPLRVLAPDGSGDVTNVAAAIIWAIDKGAKIINLSLGSTEPSPAVAQAITTATDKGIFVISSSGNSGDQAVTFPANVAGLDTTTAGLFSLSVGSVDASDNKSVFSTYGSALEIVAPGENVYGPVPGNLLGAWSGTSMSAPMVSGALALALGQNLVALPTDITHKIKSRSYNLYRQGQNPAFQDLLGDGRLDIASFLNSVMY